MERLLIIFALFGMLNACDVFLPDEGHLGQPCTPGGVCVDGSECVDGQCVNPDAADGDKDSDPDQEEDGDSTLDGDEDDVVDGDQDGPLSLSCSNGVCSDPATGFEWQETPTGGTMIWAAAKTHCQNLDLNGTGWHLPNISELRSLIRNCADIETGGACGVKDECSACGVSSGDVCLRSDSCYESNVCIPSSCTTDGGPTGCYWPDEMEGSCSWYWSSSPVEDYGDVAWFVLFDNGGVDSDSVSSDYVVRCVR